MGNSSNHIIQHGIDYTMQNANSQIIKSLVICSINFNKNYDIKYLNKLVMLSTARRKSII